MTAGWATAWRGSHSSVRAHRNDHIKVIIISSMCAGKKGGSN